MKKKFPIINREISWLAFNERVLDEAADKSVPIFERIRFLGIFSNNRDEFFRVRVASVKRLMALNERIESSDDDPKDIFNQIQTITLRQQQRYEKIYADLIDELKAENVFLVNEKQLSSAQQEFVKRYYADKVDPIVGPVMLNQVKKFPELRDKAIYLAAILTTEDKRKGRSDQFALIEVPKSLPRFILIPGDSDKKYIIILDDIIRFNLNEVFDVFKPIKVAAYTFKITRDAELDLDNDISKSFLEKMKKSLKQRKKGVPLRFVYDSEMPASLRKYLMKKMNLSTDEDALIPGGRYHNLRDLMNFPKMPGTKGYYTPMPSHPHPYLMKSDSYFAAIKKRDVFLHFPYQSFNHIIDVLKEAALDPNVKSIKICLYRVARQSKVVNALINAARNGKKVVVVFELQARFDEENNIYWSNVLEDEGVKVLFGFPGLKVHGKICLITRKEGNQTVQYANVATGNYNESTATGYGDFSLLTSDKNITSEVARVFDLFENAIWPNYRFKHLLLSPFYLRNKLVRLINKEIKVARQGRQAYVVLKMNNLVDTQLIKKLYEASCAGVKVRLIIRGICSLVPQVPGLSENIEVISIIDRFLEHARCFVFCNDGDPLYYISSADWMVRNLDRRIEVTCPIYDKQIKKEIDEVLNLQFEDNTKARRLGPDAVYTIASKDNKKHIRSQYALYDYYKAKAEKK
ncbi:MAG: polyphosphate kinase 1 [Salibacteraceae bacterium]